jgi:hypothetical protein
MATDGAHAGGPRSNGERRVEHFNLEQFVPQTTPEPNTLFLLGGSIGLLEWIKRKTVAKGELEQTYRLALHVDVCRN